MRILQKYFIEICGWFNGLEPLHLLQHDNFGEAAKTVISHVLKK